MVKQIKNRRASSSGRRIHDDLSDFSDRILLIEKALINGEAKIDGMIHISDILVKKVQANSETAKKSNEMVRDNEIKVLKKQNYQLFAILVTLGTLLIEWVIR